MVEIVECEEEEEISAPVEISNKEDAPNEAQTNLNDDVNMRQDEQAQVEETEEVNSKPSLNKSNTSSPNKRKSLSLFESLNGEASNRYENMNQDKVELVFIEKRNDSNDQEDNDEAANNFVNDEEYTNAINSRKSVRVSSLNFQNGAIEEDHRADATLSHSNQVNEQEAEDKHAEQEESSKSQSTDVIEEHDDHDQMNVSHNEDGNNESLNMSSVSAKIYDPSPEKKEVQNEDVFLLPNYDDEEPPFSSQASNAMNNSRMIRTNSELSLYSQISSVSAQYEKNTG